MLRAIALLAILLICGGWRNGSGGADVITQFVDGGRTGWNQRESILSPENVRSSGFGVICSRTNLDGEIDGQPLHLRKVTISSTLYDVIYVGTSNNTVYALNAADCTTLASVNLGTAVDGSHVAGGACETNPPGTNMGIRPAMVIDLASRTLYALAATWDGANIKLFMHALNLSTLADKVTAKLVAATATLADSSTYTFDGNVSHPRAGLAFANGNVYAAFSSYCDFGGDVTRGWLLGWNGTTLTPLAQNKITNITNNPEPDDFRLTSIWMGGASPAVDASGNVYAVTGNGGGFNSTPPGPPNALTETVVKLPGSLSSVTDYFTPYNEATLDQFDSDFGSGGITLLPDQSGAHPHLAVAAGKTTEMFLLDRDNLGGFTAGGPNAVLGNYAVGPSLCVQNYFVGGDSVPRILSCGGNNSKIWTLNTAVNPPTLTLEHTLANMRNDGGSLSTIANYIRNKTTIWSIDRPERGGASAISVFAFDENGNTIFNRVAGNWSNTINLMGVPPVVASGNVIVASDGQLYVFGMVHR